MICGKTATFYHKKKKLFRVFCNSEDAEIIEYRDNIGHVVPVVGKITGFGIIEIPNNLEAGYSIGDTITIKQAGKSYKAVIENVQNDQIAWSYLKS